MNQLGRVFIFTSVVDEIELKVFGKFLAYGQVPYIIESARNAIEHSEFYLWIGNIRFVGLL
jgi:hypothetical protein